MMKAIGQAEALSARLAVQTYLEGEALCDAGECQRGIRSLRRALAAYPELDEEEWPPWAQRVRDGLWRAAERGPPPLANADADLGGRELKELLDESILSVLASTFRRRHFVIIDNVVPSTAGDAARAEIEAADVVGVLEAASVHTRESQARVFSPDRRSDRILWLDLARAAREGPGLYDHSGGLHDDHDNPTAPHARKWSAVAESVERVDLLVKRLKETMPDELGEIVSRQWPMLSAYPTGARFELHCDNHCEHAEDGDGGLEEGGRGGSGGGDGDRTTSSQRTACANRRRLSAVLYCTEPDWKREYGGCLRIHGSNARGGGDGYSGNRAARSPRS
jgi:hypothetical protein